ncbi:hypothetical protein BaRGS_00002907, partial [Batillaria attramentaria]
MNHRRADHLRDIFLTIRALRKNGQCCKNDAVASILSVAARRESYLSCLFKVVPTTAKSTLGTSLQNDRSAASTGTNEMA